MLAKRGVVEKLVSGGDGLIREDGLVVFVPGALPGETVTYQTGPVGERICPRQAYRGPGNPRRTAGILLARFTPMRRLRLHAPQRGGPASGESPPGPRGVPPAGEKRNRASSPCFRPPRGVTVHAFSSTKTSQDHKPGSRRGGSDRTIPVTACLVAAPGFSSLLASGGRDLKAGKNQRLCRRRRSLSRRKGQAGHP